MNNYRMPHNRGIKSNKSCEECKKKEYKIKELKEELKLIERGRMYCRECEEKEKKIIELELEVKRLQSKMTYQERKITEGYFGSSTPSSKTPIKSNINPEQKKPLGAKEGHKGYGRKSISEEAASRVEIIEVEEEECPQCKVKLEGMGERDRYVIDLQPVMIEKVLYKLKRKRCPRCRQVYSATAPGVKEKSLYSNRFISHVAAEHYTWFLPLGQISTRLDVGIGSLVGSMHALGKTFKEIPDRLVEEYRKEEVRHADESTWRIEGLNGYIWFFGTEKIAIFRIRRTRASSVVKEVLNEEILIGVLVVDRYAGYNQVRCLMQYCYAHLLRHITDLQKEYPENIEVNNFVQKTAPLLSKAMKLRNLDISDKVFYKRAKRLKHRIIRVMNKPASHPGIQKIQNIFRENPNKLYHWADDRRIPADNNFSERNLRPPVIARKISFGSRSFNGANTREILMTVLLTLAKNSDCNIFNTLSDCLEQLVLNPNQDPYHVLFPPGTFN
jgi:transposase